MPRLMFVCLICSALGCFKAREPTPAAPPKSVYVPEKTAGLSSNLDSHPTTREPRVRMLPVCRSEGKNPLAAARHYYNERQFDQALSCASQAAALNPDDPQAHSERAAALSASERYEDAQLAYARALAISPDHMDALLGAAHLYAVSLPSSRERDDLGLLYAERGLYLAKKQMDQKLIAQFGLLSAMAFNDLGQARDALERAEEVLGLDRKNREAAYERAVALFELCRFTEAKSAFTSLVDDSERGAHAHQHLGLILEREGKLGLAERHFTAARRLAPDDFLPPEAISAPAFKAEVAKAVAELPHDMRRDLSGITVAAEEIPRDEDLLSGEPPLSPTILGLFRGPSLSERCSVDQTTPCRAVILYRRNLSRAVHSRQELAEQVRITLLHEVGHLRGEDDFELAARGLE